MGHLWVLFRGYVKIVYKLIEQYTTTEKYIYQTLYTISNSRKRLQNKKWVMNMEMENAKYTWKGVWIQAKGGRYYMISYNFMPLSKRKIVKEITKEEFEEYAKYVIN